MSTKLPLRCWAEIDLDALTHNWRLISQLLPSHVKPISIVKSNAYGLGVTEIVKHLKTLPQVHGYGVANAVEGREVREWDKERCILVLASPLEDEYPLLFENNLTTVICSVDEIRLLSQYAQRYEQKLDVHIKVDTGMGRMGVWHENVRELYLELKRTPFLVLKGICTHFAVSPTNPDFTRLQRLRLMEALGSLPGVDLKKLTIHCDNSAGIAYFDDNGVFNSSRVGIIQYGILPGDLPQLNELPFKPAVSWHARLSLIKKLPAGESVSYGRHYFLKEPTRVGVITAGYADGIALHMTNKGRVLINGQSCPMIGRIAMDQVVIDLSKLPSAKVGDKVTLIGKQGENEISIYEFSHNADTIPWQCICGLGHRVMRVYKHSKLAEDGREKYSTQLSCL